MDTEQGAGEQGSTRPSIRLSTAQSLLDECKMMVEKLSVIHQSVSKTKVDLVRNIAIQLYAHWSVFMPEKA